MDLDPAMSSDPLPRLRRLCLALPEAHEVIAWGEPTFRVRNKLFAMYASADTHHGGGRPALWCKAAPGNQDFLVRADPMRYFVPPYVGPSGWVGVWLDRRPRWAAVGELVAEGYQLVASKRPRGGRAAAASPRRKR
jgi:predicted DNA-binding protein (MmcQ/YjbR family)